MNNGYTDVRLVGGVHTVVSFTHPEEIHQAVSYTQTNQLTTIQSVVLNASESSDSIISIYTQKLGEPKKLVCSFELAAKATRIVNIKQQLPEMTGMFVSSSTGGASIAINGVVTGFGDLANESDKYGYYLCASVRGENGVVSYNIHGTGKEEADGLYSKVEVDAPGFVYKNQTSEYYYYFNGSLLAIAESYEITDPKNTLCYRFFATEPWRHWSDYGESTLPVTISPDEYADESDIDRRWDGYKLLSPGTDKQEFSTKLTKDLQYGKYFIPEIGFIYDSLATVKVSNVYTKPVPITANDAYCLIYIDGTALANQGKAPKQQATVFGDEVRVGAEGTEEEGMLVCPMNNNGMIFTQARTYGYGGNLSEWTLDICARCESVNCYLTGNSGDSWDWCVESTPTNVDWHFRSYADRSRTLMKRDPDYSKFFCMSLQYQNGVIHVWDKGVYVGCKEHVIQPSSERFGIGCDGWGDAQYKANALKLFRFSDKTRYIPGRNFEVPERLM